MDAEPEITVRGEDVATIGLHIAVLKAERDDALAALQRVRAHLAEWAARDCIAGNRWFDWEGNVHHVACFHCAAAEITRTLNGEGTDGR